MTDRVSVIIPTLEAAAHLPALLTRLREQTAAPDEILVVDSSSSDATVEIAREAGCVVRVIPRRDFDHGGTRNLAAGIACGDILVFLTQDALPCDPGFLAALTEPLRDGRASAAGGRQVPRDDAPPPERFAREFNYPPTSRMRELDDATPAGLKTFFFSNVCSAVRRAAFDAVGGFPERAILNEDMVLCARLLRAGHRVAYQADASVLHSHRYGIGEQLRRYFDIGVSIARAGPLLAGVRSGGDGSRFASAQLRYLARRRVWRWIPRTIVETAAKWVGFHLGLQERRIPRLVKCRLSMSPSFWVTPRRRWRLVRTDRVW